MKPKAPLNRNRSTPNSIRNGDAWSGGDHRQRHWRHQNAKQSKEPRLEFFVRSGNTEDPGKEWSTWFGPYTSTDAPIEAPPARFLQWKAIIHDGRPGDGIDWVSVAYEPKNVAPIIDGIAMQDPGVRAQAPMGIIGERNVALRQPPAPIWPSVVVIGTPADWRNSKCSHKEHRKRATSLCSGPRTTTTKTT